MLLTPASLFLRLRFLGETEADVASGAPKAPRSKRALLRRDRRLFGLVREREREGSLSYGIYNIMPRIKRPLIYDIYSYIKCIAIVK